MHTVLALSSVLLVVLGCSLALGLLRRLHGWPQRRDMQVLVLAAPVVSLGLGLGGLHHFTGRICFLGAPPWDYAIGMLLPIGMGLVALGGLGLGIVRLVLMGRVLARSAVPVGPELQTLTDQMAARLGAPRPRILLCTYGRPLALTYGLWRPTVLVSTWMMDHLDRRELEAVLAHELAHVARRDYLVIWLATVLRDAFFYLPTSWAAYSQLQREKELACDDVAVTLTQRPLALASALAKVWQQALDGPGFSMAQPLAGAGELIEDRIERLLAASGPPTSAARSRLATLGVGVSALIVMVAVQAVNVAVLLAPMGCGPASPLVGLL